MAGKIEEDGLTIHERRFVYEITRTDEGKPSTITEGYIRAYKPDGKRSTIQNEASRVKRRPRVRKAIEAILRRQELERSRTRQASLGKIHANLWTIANSTQTTPRDKIAALRELRAITDPRGDGDLESQISALSKDELVRELQARFETILGSPRVVSPEGPADGMDSLDSDSLDQDYSPGDCLEIDVVIPESRDESRDS